MSNFQQYTGDSRTYAPYPMKDASSGAFRPVVSGDICDFGTNPVPGDGRWASHAGPATVTIDPSVSVPPVTQLQVAPHYYNPGTGAPTSGSYPTGAHCTDSVGGEFDCTSGGTPGTWVTAQSATFVAAGTAGQKLTAATVAPSSPASGDVWIDTGSSAGPKTTKARMSTSTNVPDSTHTPIALDTEDLDDGNWHEGVTNPTRITVTEAGRYKVTAAAEFAPNATGIRQATLWKNGTGTGTGGRYAQNSLNAATTTGIATRCHLSTGTITLAANDYFELVLYQTSGAGLNATATSPGSTWMQIEKVS